MSAEAQPKPGWRTCRFDELAINVNERVDDPSEAGVEYYVGLEHLDSDSLTIRRWGSPADVQATKLRFRKGDIIFGRRRVYQRKLGIAHVDGICSAHAMVLRARPDMVRPEFLPFFMQSDLFMERAKEISVGSLSPTINWSALAREEFPLPTLDEQQRIADALASMDEVENAFIRLLRTGEAALAAQIAANILDTQREVPPSPLRAQGDVQYGLTLGPSRRSCVESIPYLRVANVQRGTIDMSDVKLAGRLAGDDAYRLVSGDVLVVEGHASINEIGRAAVWREPSRAMFHQNHLIRIRCAETLNPEYLALVINSELGRGYFRGQAKNTSGLNTINSTVVKDFPLPVPGVETQAAIVRGAMLIATGLAGVKNRRDELRAMKRSILTQVERP